MSLNRFLRYFNILVALLLIVAAGAGYWFLYRPLPKTGGSIEAPVGAEAVAVRDELGVPHITADTAEDAYFIQGYVTAQDRLFQMDIIRRRTAGRLSEIFGQATVESDQQARQLRLERLAEQHAANLDPEDRRIFAAYARGVNFFIETHADRLPPDFLLLKYTPRLWRISDSVLVGLELHRTLSASWKSELVKQSLIERGDPAKVETLFPIRSGLESQPGSNAWVLSGERTESGRPLLANDPHLEYSVPGTWYEVHLQAGDLDVVGASVPGLPGVVLGHNRRIAWGVTNLHFDVEDLYRERLDASTGRYVYRGRLMQAARESDTIAVRNGDSVTVSWWRTVHGPVVVSARQLHLALRWVGAEPGEFRYSFLRLAGAGNWQEFREALAGFSGPAQNFVYADVDGNIGYQAAGHMPIRGYDGSVPVDGDTGEFEWNGMIPFDALPSVYNPPDGVIVTANQNPFPKEYSYSVAGSFAPGYRAMRIRELLAAKDKWALDDMAGIQTDIHDAFLQSLAGWVVAAYEKRGMTVGQVEQAVGILRDWDGEMSPDTAAPLLARLLFHHVRKAVAEQAAPDAGLAYSDSMGPAVLAWLFKERPADWVGDYDQLLLQGLVDAVGEGRRMQGDDVGSWKYGRYNELRLPGSGLERLPIVGRYLRLDPLRLGGSPHTVQQTTPSLGPSLRLIVSPGDWDETRTVMPFGQSGERLSPHFHDQTEAYLAGESFPLQFEEVKGKDRLRFLPER